MTNFIAYFLIGLAFGLVLGIVFMHIKSKANKQVDGAVQDILQKKIDELKATNDVQIAVLKEGHETHVSEIRKGHEAQIADLRQAHYVQIADLKQNHESHVVNLKQSHEVQLKEVKDGVAVQLEEQRKRFDEIIKTVTEQMKAASDQMLKDRQKEFSEASGKNLGNIVEPLKETIERMKKAMDESSHKQTELSTELKTNIEHLIKHSSETKKSADDLANALKHGAKMQGDWGETILTNLLESQGLTKGIHFDVQATLKDKDGKQARPDVILHLDKLRSVIVDSKVSLTAYIDYVNAETQEAKDKALKSHIESIAKHVKELSAKDYSSYIQSPKQKMDYVIMFVPNTGALWTALNAQPDLWRNAMEKNVYIADEQSLYGALRIINLTWTQIVQVQNHEKVFELADQMIDRVGKFIQYFEKVGKSLKDAQNAYDEAGKKLEERGHSIIYTSRRLIKLGAKQNDKNPIPDLIDMNDIPEIDENI